MFSLTLANAKIGIVWPQQMGAQRGKKSVSIQAHLI